MKTNIKFSKKQELILQILYAAKKYSNFSISELEKAVHVIMSEDLILLIYNLRIISGKVQDLILSHPFGSHYLTPFEEEIQGLEFNGFVAIDGTVTNDLSLISLTEEGTEIAKRLKDARRVILKPRIPQRESVFIASAFGHEDTDSLYSECFAPACESLDYKPKRVDLSEQSATITAIIMEGITEAACIIADLTYARPSVYFEVGYALGLGIPLMLTCRKDHYHGMQDSARVHFDLEQFKISYWGRNSKGKFSWQKSMKPVERLSTILKPYKRIEE